MNPPEPDYIDQARAVLQTEIDELASLADRIGPEFSQAVNTLCEGLSQRGKIIVIGVGKSENIATKIAATLNSTGAPAVVLNCQNALHGDLGIMAQGDTVLALSYSGETAELLNLLPHLKRRAAAIIAFTGKPGSSLAANSDVVLDTSVATEACPLQLAPTSSSTNMLALGDALAMVLLQARGFQPEDFAELHPGGSLGRQLLTRVTDIMRKGNQLACVQPTDTIAAALAAMKQCKAGAVLATDAEGQLQGIFTHGDFVRSYQKDRNIADHRIADHMTANPVTIQGDKLAAEAVHVLEENRIDEIVVIDADQKVVGLVDVQDLSRAQIF
ncbi:MAG: KpsF/GutQ family sugar-phosphate isomerase [Verrucomicrobiales bacterium]|nr:KpsF/GutQ family sugar-phosphate isomerase [Verrucomicrobiales bacterium]MBL68667.1 KpsF/GutQ family sugar-phosphate isomerase [Verrucomicrobiales bacterium]|tara:strand:- start:20667 stop:21653 length:987 start_codon:yes stop_codon:yes gene_type:complete